MYRQNDLFVGDYPVLYLYPVLRVSIIPKICWDVSGELYEKRFCRRKNGHCAPEFSQRSICPVITRSILSLSPCSRPRHASLAGNLPSLPQSRDCSLGSMLSCRPSTTFRQLRRSQHDPPSSAFFTPRIIRPGCWRLTLADGYHSTHTHTMLSRFQSFVGRGELAAPAQTAFFPILKCPGTMLCLKHGVCCGGW